MIKEMVSQVLNLYPRVYFACHTRHVQDPQSRKIISAHQASILDHLDETEPIQLTELARHMGVTPSTMSLAVDRLVNLGLVVRGRDSRDGRRVMVRLTPEGLRIREAKSVLDPQRIHAVLERLSPREREEAVHGLSLLARAAGEEMRSQSLGKGRTL